MKKAHWNTLLKLVNESTVFVLGIISPIITILQLFWGNSSISLIVANIVLLVLFVISYLFIKRNQKLSLGLVLLAQDGHIHTTRMLILRDNYETIKHSETIADKNDFKSRKTTFTFHINEELNNTSTVTYNHSFDISPNKSGDMYFAPWYFGEDEFAPTKCLYRVDTGEWQNVISTPIIEGCHDYAANEGIYTTTIPLGKKKKGEYITIDFKYERTGAFRWDREEIFVIWPQCFAKEMSMANFEIHFCGNVSKVVSIVEYVCHGLKPRKCTKAILTPDISDTKSIYRVNDLNIKADNVYVIYITDPIE